MSAILTLIGIARDDGFEVFTHPERVAQYWSGNANTSLLLSRIQFAFTISFHIIFPSFTIGPAAWLTVLEALGLATRRPAYRVVFEFWLKIFGVAFGLGVVSGIVMGFQFSQWIRCRRLRASSLSPRRGRTNAPVSAAPSRSSRKPFPPKWVSTRSAITPGPAPSISSSADSSCLMHKQGCAERIGLPIKFIHIAQILNGASA
jgi:hypothetical protein